MIREFRFSAPVKEIVAQMIRTHGNRCTGDGIDHVMIKSVKR